MRTLLLILLVMAGLAASIRIDGFWPPEPARQFVAQTVTRIAEPGKVFLVLAGHLVQTDAKHRRIPGFTEPAAMFRAVVESQRTARRPEAECS